MTMGFVINQKTFTTHNSFVSIRVSTCEQVTTNKLLVVCTKRKCIKNHNVWTRKL